MNSKNFVIASTLLVVFCLTLAPSNISAQQQTTVCIVDMAKVFKNHPTFNQNLAKLQQDAELLKQTVNGKKGQLIARREQLNTLDANSQQFRNEESALAQAAAKLEVDAKNQIQQLSKREADLHFQTYEQVRQIIGNYCQQRGIQIVMTYSNEEVDLADPNSIMARVNSNVVYSTPNVDLTMMIIQGLAPARTANGQGTPNFNK